jgi:molecular chaperone GrpE
MSMSERTRDEGPKGRHAGEPEAGDRVVKSAREIIEERLAARGDAGADAEAAAAGPASGDGASGGAGGAPGSPGSGPAVETEPAAELQALRQKAKERDEYLDQALRARADLDNYQKRIQREMTAVRETAAQGLIHDVLQPLDNLDLTVRAAEKTRDVDTLLAAVKMALAQFAKVLADRGVTPIDAALGVPFDPRRHEAVAVVERADLPASAVVDELRRGYMIRDRVLRASQVRVSKRPEGESAGGAGGGAGSTGAEAGAAQS